MKYFLAFILCVFFAYGTIILTPLQAATKGAYFIKVESPTHLGLEDRKACGDLDKTNGQLFGEKALGVISFMDISLEEQSFKCGYRKTQGQYLSKQKFAKLHTVIECSYGCKDDQFAIADLRGAFERN